MVGSGIIRYRIVVERGYRGIEGIGIISHIFTRFTSQVDAKCCTDSGLIVFILQTTDGSGKCRIRSGAIHFRQSIGFDCELSFANSKRTRLVGDIVVGYRGGTRSGNGIGTHSFTSNTAVVDTQQRQDVSRLIAICQSCKAHRIVWISSTVGLAFVIHRHRQVGLGDGEYAIGIGNMVVALRVIPRSRNGIGSHSLSCLTAQRAGNKVGRLSRHQTCYGSVGKRIRVGGAINL